MSPTKHLLDQNLVQVPGSPGRIDNEALQPRLQVALSMHLHFALCVFAGAHFNHEGGLPQSAAFLLLRRHDLHGLHLLRLDCARAVPRKGKNVVSESLNLLGKH